MKTSDSDIQEAVLRELRSNSRVHETEVGVEVDDGVVTLSGTVSSWAKRLAAQDAAHHVPGVLDVANDLKVKVPSSRSRNDTDIAHAVRHALEWDSLVPEGRIRSTVSEGWVTLEGRVDSFSQKEDAERCIRNLSGLKGVTNLVEVEAPRIVARELRESIEFALRRHAQRDAAHIDIDVNDGKISLTGRVHSWAEKQAVLGAAKSTYGVSGVDDHIRIEPFTR